jgi:hypothetical protein
MMSDSSPETPQPEKPEEEFDPFKFGVLIGLPIGATICGTLHDPLGGMLIGGGIILVITAVASIYQVLRRRYGRH